MSGSDIVVLASARTDVGQVRQRNEDSVRFGPLGGEPLADGGEMHRIEGERGPLAIVCDGMGGEAAGDVASALAAETIWTEMAASKPTTDRDILARLLRRALRRANLAIIERSADEPECEGMGTTASVAALAGDTLVLAQVGDSRAYLRRQDRLVQLTRDQSVVAALISAGKLRPSEANLSSARSLVLQALGTDRDVDVSLSVAALRRGDRLLLCSDGLHGCVGDAAIAHAMEGELDVVTETLVRRAHQAGAPDNVTVLVAEFQGEGLGAPGEGDELVYSELDPSEEGEDAVAHTGRVARKLAARAGFIDTSTDPGLPATGMYASVGRGGGQRSAGPRAAAAARPAERRLRRNASVGLLAWLLAAAALAAALAWIWWM